MFNINKKILVIAPHADDEILGCGGYLTLQKRKGANIHVLFGTIGGDDKLQNLKERINEVNAVANNIGFTFDVIEYNMDAKMDLIESKKIISIIDKTIEKLKPDEVFVNYASAHQDHKKIFDCAMAAFRLKDGFMPNFIALYEYPFVNGTITSIDGGRMYVDISSVIVEKSMLFYLYKSQVKKNPSPLNEDGIKSLARIRGIECGKEYAELFYIQKIVL